MEKACIELYTAKETAEAINLTGHRLHIIEPEKQFKIGDWTAMGFPTEHDAAGSLGFLLQKGDIKCLYLVDSLFCRYSFKGLTHVLISINYCTEILKENVKAGNVHPDLANRILANHLSLKTAEDFFQQIDKSKLLNVYILHISNQNGDFNLFKNRIASITGVPIYGRT